MGFFDNLIQQVFHFCHGTSCQEYVARHFYVVSKCSRHPIVFSFDELIVHQSFGGLCLTDWLQKQMLSFCQSTLCNDLLSMWLLSLSVCQTDSPELWASMCNYSNQQIYLSIFKSWAKISFSLCSIRFVHWFVGSFWNRKVFVTLWKALLNDIQ